MLHHFSYVAVLCCTALTVRCQDYVCREGDITYKKGEKWETPGECTQSTCQEDGTVAKLGCGYLRLSDEEIVDGWTLSDFDPSKPWPTCCPQPLPPLQTTPGESIQPCVVDGKTYEFGEQRDIPGKCIYNICVGNDEWSTAECDLVSESATPEDLSKPYPECCAKSVLT